MLVPEQQRALAEIRRVLRPGGRCAYATWGLPQHNPWIFHVVAALLQNGVAPPGDAFAPGGIFSLATAESHHALAAAAGFTDVTVDELTGAMRFDGPDDYWIYIAAVAGPVPSWSARSTAMRSRPFAAPSTLQWRRSNTTAHWKSPGWPPSRASPNGRVLGRRDNESHDRRPISLAGGHPRRRSARLGARPQRADGGRIFRRGIRAHAHRSARGARHRRPHPLCAPSRRLSVQLLARRRQPARAVAADHAGQLPQRQPATGMC